MSAIKIIIILLYSVLFVAIFIQWYGYLTKRKHDKLKQKLDNISMEKDKSYSLINNYLKTKKEGYFSYARINKFLKETGNPYDFSPAGYIVSKFLISFVTFLVFVFVQKYSWGIGASFLGFFFLDIYLKYKNRQDMKIIKRELSDVYDLLNIQTSAGVFMGTALSEAYLIVSNKRFARALNELSAEISITKDIGKALENFSTNFNSIEIEGFVMTIKQSLITGQAQQTIEDMSGILKDINLVEIQDQTNRIKSINNTIQVLIFLGIMATIVFALAIEIQKSWGVMFNT